MFMIGIAPIRYGYKNDFNCAIYFIMHGFHLAWFVVA